MHSGIVRTEELDDISLVAVHHTDTDRSLVTMALACSCIHELVLLPQNVVAFITTHSCNKMV